MSITIHQSNSKHLPAITKIYNHSIENTTSVYSEEIVSLQNRTTWFNQKQESKLPVLVALEDEKVLGFASYGQFRTWPGYKFTVEHSVHVSPNARRRGIATLLLQELLVQAKKQNLHSMIGGIDADNKGSIALHEKLGFKSVALIPEAGYKFGKWLDLVLMQKLL